MTETVLNVVLMLAILGGAFVITQWFANHMYYRCPACGTLNAKRREKCRRCSSAIGPAKKSKV